MRSEFRLVVLAAVSVLIGATAAAQVFPTRLDQQTPQPRIPVPIALELSDGGIQFPDGSVQSTAPHGADRPCYDGVHRFVDCQNGTVTDTVTGLVWLENLTCLGVPRTYMEANATAATLSEPGCGDLTDGSQPGDWRLPTAAEWSKIVNKTCQGGPRFLGNQTPYPACFEDVPWATGVTASGTFWSSNTSGSTTKAEGVQVTTGVVYIALKDVDNYVWPVRGNTRQF